MRIIWIVLIGLLSSSALAQQDAEQPTFDDTMNSIAIDLATRHHDIQAITIVEGPSKWALVVSTGISYSQAPPNRLWNQRDHGYHTDEDNSSPFFRLGIEYDGYRFSLFQLYRYFADNRGSNDEACVEANGVMASKVCAYENKFVTMGSAKGVSLSKHFEYKHVFIELGATYVWRKFSIQVSNAVAPYDTMYDIYSGTAHGMGWMVGIGYVNGDFSIGLWAYDDSLAKKFEYNEGRHLTGILAGQYRFNIR